MLNKEKIIELLKTDKYDFIKNMKIVLMVIGGSYGNGTARESSDLDIRIVRENTLEEIAGVKKSKTYSDNETDTVVYPFDIFLEQLISGKTSALEILGTDEKNILYVSDEGREILENKDKFYCIKTANNLCCYSLNLLKEIIDGSSETEISEQERKELYLNTIRYIRDNFQQDLLSERKGAVVVDVNNNYQIEIGITTIGNISLEMLEDYAKQFLKLQSQFGKNNRKTRRKNGVKLSKQVAQCCLYYLMGIDMLNGKLRLLQPEHDKIFKIKIGEYLSSEDMFTDKLKQYVDELQKRYDEARLKTCIPKEVDKEFVSQMKIRMCKKVILQGE